MNEADRIHRAERAKLLLEDDLFAEILTTVRLNALNELATVDPDDKTAIQRQQAIVAVTGDIKDMLDSAIIATGEHDGGFSLNSSKGE